MKNKTKVLGLMSGSSLDGLDACLAEFVQNEDGWCYTIQKSETLIIPEHLVQHLRKSADMSAINLLSLDISYGEWIGSVVRELAQEADLIALHGHTVFHSPKDKISLQVGSGEVVHVLTNKPVVANFRNVDILLGGQGAPLVPLGEKLLFPQFHAFLNLGGICNASFSTNASWIAGDIGPFNQVFNHYAHKLGQPMDANGALARSGQMIARLVDKWSAIPYFKESFPKSLANQWVSNHFLDLKDEPKVDVLHTFGHFISDQIAQQINKHKPKKVLITGGGAKNGYLMELLRSKCHSELIVPDAQLIDSKEALIFGLLGLLRFQNEKNVLSSCTGASRDSSSGVIYQ